MKITQFDENHVLWRMSKNMNILEFHCINGFGLSVVINSRTW